MLPGSVPEALDMLASDGAAIPIAGGTDLLVHWPVRVDAHDRTYMDLSRLDALKPISWTRDELTLGALTTYWDVIQDPRAREEFPLLVDAARQVGGIQIPYRRYSYQVFEKVGARRAQAIAKVGLAVTHSGAGWRVVAASVAPTIRRCPAVERLLETGAAPAAPGDLLPAIGQDVAPIDDIRSSAHYRTRVMAQLLYHDLRDVWGKRP